MHDLDACCSPFHRRDRRLDASRQGGRHADPAAAQARLPGPDLPVHRDAGEIQGLRAYPSLAAIGVPVSQAIVAVPAAAAA